VRFLRDEAARVGRDGRRIEVSQTIFTLVLVDSAAQARSMAETFGGMLGLSPDAVRRSPLFLGGTPDECIAELRRRKTEWGLAETIFHCEPSVLRRLGEQVLPHV
jgi:alkanesulfonate monooxygenase SsuD/methylene tetrahydromethanopterin reductase-like flavin-dependent oxidoreductase (luciferase family)